MERQQMRLCKRERERERERRPYCVYAVEELFGRFIIPPNFEVFEKRLFSLEQCSSGFLSFTAFFFSSSYLFA